jgi:hypothetical protein
MSEAKIQKIIDLYQSGKSFVTVGKELIVNPEAIRQTRIRGGVQIRWVHELRSLSQRSPRPRFLHVRH